jgi:lipopolysaccharide export system protein LptA
VDAEQVNYEFKSRLVTFTGNPVRLVREDAVLTCRRLQAENDERGQIVRATCRGDVRFVRGERTVTCETARFENAQSLVICEGSPELRDGPTVARGERLVYDLRADAVKLDKPVITMPGDEVDAKAAELERQRRERRER